MTPRNLSSELSVRGRQLVALIFFILQVVALATASDTNQSPRRDEFYEDLYLRPLSDGKLFAHFQFTTLYRKDIKSLRWENKFEIFPLSVADLVATTDLHELHFSLTKGNWNYKNWGYPTRSSPPGAQIRAKFSRHNEDPTRSWQRLVNLLAGKFCASLASADRRALVETKFSLDHQLMTPYRSSSNSTTSSSSSSAGGDPELAGTSGSQSGERVFYSNLPEETMCTENLTPWKKLLPCYSNSGLASLLNAVNLLKSSYSSLAIEMEPRQCLDKDGDFIVGCEQVQLTQSMSVIFNPLLQFEGRQSWSLAKMFGNSIQKLCRVASHSLVHVDLSDLDDKGKLYPQTFDEYSLHLGPNTPAKHYATFDLQSLIGQQQTLEQKQAKSFNLGVKQSQSFKRPAYSSRPTIPVYLRTHIAGLGAYEGTIVATVSNQLDEPLRVTYMDAVPYFLRVYLHTLTIRTSSGQELKPDRLNFDLSRHDTPTLIEFSLVLPAKSETQISYDFVRAFLRWTDFKPDANKGVLLGPATIGIPLQSALNHLVMPLCTSTQGRASAARRGGTDSSNSNSTVLQLVELDNEMLHIHSRPLLVILPTPDFSMPYNVLCLVSTVLVAAFGPLHNMTTRRPVIKMSKRALEEQKKKKREREKKEESEKQD